MAYHAILQMKKVGFLFLLMKSKKTFNVKKKTKTEKIEIIDIFKFLEMEYL